MGAGIPGPFPWPLGQSREREGRIENAGNAGDARMGGTDPIAHFGHGLKCAGCLPFKDGMPHRCMIRFATLVGADHGWYHPNSGLRTVECECWQPACVVRRVDGAPVRV